LWCRFRPHEDEHAAQLEHRRAAALLDDPQRGRRRVGVVGDRLRRRAGLHEALGQGVGDRVVELGRDPRALGEHGQSFVSRAASDPARAARSALGVAGVAVLSALLFFTGLPLVLGPAAAYLGREARNAAVTDGQRRRGTTAIVVGALCWAIGAAAALFY
jgi:hypothetical protein